MVQDSSKFSNLMIFVYEFTAMYTILHSDAMADMNSVCSLLNNMFS